MGAACKKVKVKVKDSVLGELLQLEELPGPLLLDNMQDEVHSITHIYTHTYTHTYAYTYTYTYTFRKKS